MIAPRHMPADAYIDDPSTKLDHLECIEELSKKLASESLVRVFAWIMQGKIEQRSLRFHIVVLYICPQLIPCKHPSATWCADIHHYSKQRASELGIEFTKEFGGRIQFRGQRFRSHPKL